MTSSFSDTKEHPKNLQPRDFLKTYFTFESFDVSLYSSVISVLKKLHQIFGPGGITGDTLIDITEGPCFYQLLSACESFREIIVTDYMDQNLKELETWLKKEPGAFDWSPIVKFVCQQEGDSEKWREKEEMLRTKVKKLLQCDITKKNPLEPVVLPQADCVITFFCMTSVCKDLDTFVQAMKNITSLLKPGGHLVLFMTLKGTYYMVGQQRFSCLYLEKEQVEKAVEEAGCCVKHLEVTPVPAKETFALSDYHDTLYLVANKRQDI